jgi:hypothetical protein
VGCSAIDDDDDDDVQLLQVLRLHGDALSLILAFWFQELILFWFIDVFSGEKVENL